MKNASSIYKLIVGLAVATHAVNGAGAAETVKVFVLAGQSNMEGKVQRHQIDYEATAADTKDKFKHLREGDARIA